MTPARVATLLAALLLGALVPPAQADLARAQRQVAAQDLPGAQATLERHLAQTPEDAEARFLLARVLAWQGRPDAALAHYRWLLTREPDNADYLLGEGQALLWAGRPQPALVSLERAAQRAPDYPEVQRLIAQARAALELPALGEPALPVADHRRRHELELSLRHEDLDSGSQDWLIQRLDYASNRPQAVAWYGALLQEQRFGQRDQGIELGAVLPLDGHWALQAELGYQPSPAFLPKGYADLRLQRRLPAGWVGALSLRHTEYQDSRIDRLALSAERYFSHWRASYSLNLSRVEGAGHPLGHALGLDRYYQGLSHLGLRLNFGEEEGLEAGRVITSRVRGVALQGRHWFGPRWALSWQLGRLRQGDYYRRDGVMLGIRHVF